MAEGAPKNDGTAEGAYTAWGMVVVLSLLLPLTAEELPLPWHVVSCCRRSPLAACGHANTRPGGRKREKANKKASPRARDKKGPAKCARAKGHTVATTKKATTTTHVGAVTTSGQHACNLNGTKT
jgi:hypothetical protein